MANIILIFDFYFFNNIIDTYLTRINANIIQIIMRGLTMSRKIIDLTLTMENGSAWNQFPRQFLFNHEAEEPATRILEFFNHQHGKHWWSIYRFETTTQSFTHMSSPKHFYRNKGLPIDQMPFRGYSTATTRTNTFCCSFCVSRKSVICFT